jgi:mannosyltransferase OCH1-like enzyme
MQKYQWNATNLLVIQRADILRMLALQEYGGIFIDLDIRVYDW